MGMKNVFIIREGTDDAKHAAAFEETGFWGKQAAGCLFYAQDTGRLLFAQRSEHVLEPHTWGTWGGAMDDKETPEQAVRREVGEEAGVNVKKLVPVYVFKSGTFRYHNFLAIVPAEFQPRLDKETEGYAWVAPGEWPEPLHPGAKTLVKREEFEDALEELSKEEEA